MTLTNILLILATSISLLFWFHGDIFAKGVYLFWMHNTFFLSWNYEQVALQFLFYSFLHGSFFHLLFNSIFIYFFGNIVENIVKEKTYILFFLFSTLFNGIFIALFSNGTTIGMSGFWLSILTFYTLFLFFQKNQEYRWGITAIILNVALWFIPGISFVWHLAWVVTGSCFFFIRYYFFKKKALKYM